MAIGEPHATRFATRYGAAWLGLALYDRNLTAFSSKMNRSSQTIVARTHRNRIAGHPFDSLYSSHWQTSCSG
jgi:hypothetical protein